jgi:penicillin-insensitive murein endopeptidase
MARAVAQDPMPIGSYAKGCARGAGGTAGNRPDLAGDAPVAQPQLRPADDGAVPDGPVATARDIGFGKGLYIGDMSQPRGGPMTSGHASHQIGLDADIWMLPPRSLSLTEAEREEISSIPVRSADQRSVTENWTKVHRELLKQAALDPRVDRIFVAAAVKIEMCRPPRPRTRNGCRRSAPSRA